MKTNSTVNASELSTALRVKSDVKAGTTIIIIVEPSPGPKACFSCGLGGGHPVLQAAKKA